MARTVLVKDRDLGWKKIKRLAKQRQGPISLGILARDTNRKPENQKKGSKAKIKEPLTNAAIGAVHEFGTVDGRIPERSFLRATIDNNIVKYRKLARRLMKRVLTLKLGHRQALGIFAEKIKGDVQRTIRKGIDPALKPATIRRKGSSKPLIDTGQLVASINYRIE